MQRDSPDLMIWLCSEAHLANVIVIQTHLSRHFTLTPISSAYTKTGLRRRSSIKPRIFWNKLLGRAALTNWKVTLRPWRTTFAPNLTSISRSVVSDQCATAFGKASVRMSYLDCRPGVKLEPDGSVAELAA